MDLSALIRANLSASDDRHAIEFEAQWHGWAGLRSTGAAVDDLLTQQRCPPGTRVGIVMRNRPEFVAALAALLASRRPAVMIYASQSAQALSLDLRAQGLAAVIAAAADWTEETLAAVHGSDGTAIALDSAGGAQVKLSRVRSHETGSAADDGDIAGGTAVEMLTSGTTGTPKRIAISRRSIDAAAETLLGGDHGLERGRDSPPDVIPFPIANISGLYFLLPALATGRRVVLLERFEVEPWLSAVRRNDCVAAALPPAAVSKLMDSGLGKGDLGSLGVIGVGAAPLDPDLQDQFEDRFGVTVTVGYGATEFAGVIATWTADERRRVGRTKRGSVGRAVPGVSLRVVDEDSGRELPVGAHGVLEARVPRVGPGYLRTSDLAHLDCDGYLYLHGRADQTINRGGFKVSPDKVAAALQAHAAVREAAVVGLDDAALGQVPVAAVELRTGRPGPTGAQLRDYLRRELRSFEIPARILVVGSLPRTPSMKVQLGRLKAMFTTEPTAAAVESAPTEPSLNGQSTRLEHTGLREAP